MRWRKLTPFQKAIVNAGIKVVLLGTLFGMALLSRPGLLPYLHVLVYPACAVLGLVGLWHYRLIEKMNVEQREVRLRLRMFNGDHVLSGLTLRPAVLQKRLARNAARLSRRTTGTAGTPDLLMCVKL